MELESLGAGAAGRELQNRRFIAALEAPDAAALWPRVQAELPELRGEPALGPAVVPDPEPAPPKSASTSPQ